MNDKDREIMAGFQRRDCSALANMMNFPNDE